MTIDEALKYLTDFSIYSPYQEAIDKVSAYIEQMQANYKNRLKADKNNSGDDCISRAQAIERLKLNFPISDGADNSRDRHRYMQTLADIQAIRELSPMTPQEPRKRERTEFHCGIEESGGHAYNCNDCPNKCEEWHQWDKEMKR